MPDPARTSHTVYLPRTLVKRAHALGLNVSAILQDALYQAIETELNELHRLVDIGELSQQRLDAIDKLEADEANEAAGDGSRP